MFLICVMIEKILRICPIENLELKIPAKVIQSWIKENIILIILLLPFLFSCRKKIENGQETIWQRSPNLKLIAKPVPPFKAYSDPVYSPSGKIYYLAAYKINEGMWVKQALKVINIDGTGDRILLQGNFQCLDISPRYDRLIIGTDDGKLILVDTSGSVISEYKTFFHYDSVCIICVRYSCSDSYVYYTGGLGSIFRMNLIDSTEEFIQAESSPFDLICPYNRIFRSLGFTGDGGWPSVFSDSFFVATYFNTPDLIDLTPEGEENQYVLMGLLKDPQNVIRLNEIKPYEKSTFYRPIFSPDGKKLIFSAYDARWEQNPHSRFYLAEYLELWIYEKFDELVEKYFGKRR
ncbi:MAG: WD40 repeat domain-containing protein [candidate division WOR-3 bacterium]